MSRRYIIADVFTDTRFKGNPLAVVLDGQGLSDPAMQVIAREFNLSETVFVLPPDDPRNAHRLRIFTPANELPFAGHPTVGATIVIATTLRRPGDPATFVLEENVGPIPVRFDSATMTASFTVMGSPTIREGVASPDVLAAMLSLTPADLGPPAWTASSGAAFLMVPLRSAEALARIRLDVVHVAACLTGADARGVYPFADLDGSGARRRVRARMFAPNMGISEDPATGSAATALVGSLALSAGKDGSFALDIEQGVEMGRDSLIVTDTVVAGGQVSTITVSGGAVIVADGMLLL
jgi:trans-2,3-dihydro-3-hydroxyanthranilate isomerase